jgi:tetratricopeptide (TPR) repeat protein
VSVSNRSPQAKEPTMADRPEQEDGDEEGSYTGSYDSQHGEEYHSGDEHSYDEDDDHGDAHDASFDSRGGNKRREAAVLEGSDSQEHSYEEGGSYDDGEGGEVEEEGEGSYSQSRSYSDRTPSHSYDDHAEDDEGSHYEDDQQEDDGSRTHTSQYDDDENDDDDDDVEGDGSYSDHQSPRSQDEQDADASEYDDHDDEGSRTPSRGEQSQSYDEDYDDSHPDDYDDPHREEEEGSYDSQEGHSQGSYEDDYEEGTGSQHHDDDEGSHTQSQPSEYYEGSQSFRSQEEGTAGEGSASYYDDEDNEGTGEGSHSRQSQSQSYTDEPGEEGDDGGSQDGDSASRSVSQRSHSQQSNSQSRSQYSGSYRSGEGSYDEDGGENAEDGPSQSGSYTDDDDRSQSQSNSYEADGSSPSKASVGDANRGNGKNAFGFPTTGSQNQFLADAFDDASATTNQSGSQSILAPNTESSSFTATDNSAPSFAGESDHRHSRSNSSKTKKERTLPFHKTLEDDADAAFESSFTGTSGVDSFANDALHSTTERSYDPFAQNNTFNSKGGGGGWSDNTTATRTKSRRGGGSGGAADRQEDHSATSGTDSFGNEPSFANDSGGVSFNNDQEASFANEDAGGHDDSFAPDESFAIDDDPASPARQSPRSPASQGTSSPRSPASPKSPGERFFSPNFSDGEENDEGTVDPDDEDVEYDEEEVDGAEHSGDEYEEGEEDSYSSQSQSHTGSRSQSQSLSQSLEQDDEEPSHSRSYSDRSQSRSGSYSDADAEFDDSKGSRGAFSNEDAHDESQRTEDFTDGDPDEQDVSDDDGGTAELDGDDEQFDESQRTDDYADEDVTDNADEEGSGDSFFEKTLISREPDQLPPITEHSVEQSVEGYSTRGGLSGRPGATRTLFQKNNETSENDESVSSFEGASVSESVQKSVESIRHAALNMGSRPGAASKSGSRSVNSRGAGSTGSGARSEPKSVASMSESGLSHGSRSHASQRSASSIDVLRERLKRTASLNKYSREQMQKVIEQKNAATGGEIEAKLAKARTNGTSRTRPRRPKISFKSEELLELVEDVNTAMLELEETGRSDWAEGKEVDMDSTAKRLLFGFEALAGIQLQVSDELELMSTFARKKDAGAIEALDLLLTFAPILCDIFSQLKPILLKHLVEEIGEEMNDFLYCMNLMVDLLCEVAHDVGEKQEWNLRVNTVYATLLELLSRDTLEVCCISDDVDTPDYEPSETVEEAWNGTGHEDEFKILQGSETLDIFRQICYDVLISADQWCPDPTTLMDICWIDPSMVEEDLVAFEDDEIVEPPEAALQILEKINGDPLPRSLTLSRVIRRILPTDVITDLDLRRHIHCLKNNIRVPLELPSSNLVAISSVPEVLNEPEAQGITAVGKSTLAAMVANHPDVRRFFLDGIAWIHVGRKEINYSRYVLFLREIVGQLGVPEEEEPLFPELLHVPGESRAKRRRREEGFMFYIRDIMTNFLKFRNVLIIIDDICFEPDLDWFDFDPAELLPEDAEEDFTCAILVTTRCRNLLPAADTVEVDMLEESEAVEMLIRESAELSGLLSADSPEIKSVVQECANHPLAVKSVARWLNLKHATADSSSSDLQAEVVRSMEKILKRGNQEDADMMYEILNMSLSPAINGEPTAIIKFCFAAFVLVFCDQKHLSDFALVDATPIVPLVIAELLFVSLLDLEEETLLQEGSLFYAQKKEAAVLIPEALTALGVLKGIVTFAEATDDGSQPKEVEEKYLQVMHSVQEEYGEFLYQEETSLADLMKDGETRWNRAFAEAYMASDHSEWDTESPDSGLDYALEMLPAHMIRGGMLSEAASLLSDGTFVRGRLFALGRENGTRRHIKDCEVLFDLLLEQRVAGRKKIDPKATIKQAYQTLGGLLNMDEDEYIAEPGSPEALEVARSQYEIGYSLAEKRCWEAAIAHWESSQELLVSALGMVEIVAGIQLNVGVVFAEMNEYEQALGALKQCLRIRGALHGEEHILYAQTIQKIGDIFLSMSDYHESMESYNWALDVMHIEPSHHRIDIGDVLENMGNIHYSKGEIEESLQCFQDALRSKQVDLGEDHPELATTYHHIGNCLSDQGKTDEAIVHFEEAIRLKQMDPDGGGERDADVLTIQGVLHNLNGRQHDGLECYEKALQILVTKVPHRKEKVASLLHLIGCVYLMSGEHKKAMKLFEESLQARRKVLGFVHLDVASTLFNMAFLYQSRGKLDKALKCLEEALKIRQLRLPDSEKVSITHEKIGTLARSLGKTKKAEIAFLEALRIRRLIHGDKHEAVATVLQELGDLMDDLGEYDDAMKHYVEALDIRQTQLGPDDLAVAETLYSMGFCLQNKEASERALQCFEEALSIRQYQLGDDAKEVGDTLNMMGFLQAQRGELDEALSLLWDALRIRKLLNDRIKVSETLKNIGNVHREKQEYELAIECYEECLRIRRSELGDDHEKVADALIAIGNVQSDVGNSDDAMRSYEDGKCA